MCALAAYSFGCATTTQPTRKKKPVQAEVVVAKTKDFELSGDGSSNAWAAAEWFEIPQRKMLGSPYKSEAKLLYSKKGLYVLFRAEDSRLTASMTEDNSHLWKEDVFELFIWPDPDVPIYFEYELSPLNVELTILVPNIKGKHKGWLPWEYNGDRKTRHETSAIGGELASYAKVEGWIAEIFIPYALLKPLVISFPQAGDSWRINLYRNDHDSGERASWEWAPVDDNYHDYLNFGHIRFE